MSKKFIFIVSLLILPLVPFFVNISFASNMGVEYLCEIGTTMYNNGRYDDALSEFNKVLAVDPQNPVAKQYVDKIFTESVSQVSVDLADGSFSEQIKPSLHSSVPVDLDKQEAINKEFDKLSQKEEPFPDFNDQKLLAKDKKEPTYKVGPVGITGTFQLAFGVDPEDFIWKRANFDLNEKFKSWRLLSTAVYNKKFNTYDPRVYDSLSVNFDTLAKEGLNFHGNLTVDPWSFTGVSENATVTNGTDTADIQLRYWSNTSHIVNHTFYSQNAASTINVPEMEVNNYKTEADSINGFTIPGERIHQQFQPVRELWLDYSKDSANFRIFPMAYQDQALSSDDPLGITNHRIWWQDSHWLRRYMPGAYHSAIPGVGPAFTKGVWDDTYSFATKDSTGKYLTALRGLSLNVQPSEDTYFASTLSTPKDLWQDYDTVDNITSATRFKQNILDNLSLGATFTARFGFTTDSNMALDAQNYVGGLDLGYEVIDGVKASAEILASKTYSDTTSQDYKSESQGNAYYVSLITRYPAESIMDLKYTYEDIKPPKDGSFMVKARLYGARMDTGFNSALSNYHNTRQDVFWGRHIHFRKPFEYYYSGLEGPTTKWDELDATRIGDGIDIGRNVVGFRIDGGKADSYNNLFDIRYVTSVKGDNIETVIRDELTVKITDKLTAKGLGLYQRMPKTVSNTDPFIYDGNTGQFWQNSLITDGEDPSLKTGSIGLNYDFFDWLSLNGIFERTNDYTLAYGDFPRNIYKNDTTMTHAYWQNDKQYVNNLPFLYNQNFFPLPPYPYYNVYKVGFGLSPLKNMDIYLDYTRNEFEGAGQVSDGMNHIGLDVTYMPIEKFGMAVKYVYSRWKDPNRFLDSGYTNITGHHNVFAECRYFPTKDDELILQYGEGNASQIGNMTLDPYGSSNLTIDTQHIFRAYYRRRF